jgi:hypothetical protein
MEYESGDLDAAARGAGELAREAPGGWSAHYLAMRRRYEALAREGLKEGWSPIWNLTSK